jgi:ATP-dependent Clp protease ATP-binding subunit ClpA
VIVVKDEAGADKLGFEFVEGPVTPKPEKLPEQRAKPKRRAGVRRGKPAAPKSGGDGGDVARRGSVPKVPLKV